jgi:DNA-binding response OmpR family regulator
MRYSGDSPLPQISASSPTPPTDTTDSRPTTRVWTRAARREIEARLDAIQRASFSLGASPSTAQRAALDALQDAASQARRTLDTLDTLLNYHDAPPRLTSVVISDLLIAALSRWKTHAPRHTFELALPGHEPSLIGDAMRIERAIDALIAWIVASSPGGDVRVSLRYAAPPARSDSACATDEAVISLRARLREGLAAPLGMEAHLAMDEGDPPASLHLILAREVASAHGGRAWASPGPEEQMLTLGLALPATPPLAPFHLDTLVDSGAAPVDGDNEDEPGIASGPSLPLARQRQVALVAHGDPRMARYLRSNLERAGYQALTAADLATTLRQVDAEEPDVILLDAALPTEAPHDPLQRALARTNAPIILLTRDGNPTHAANALDTGAADVIAMPFSVEETIARIRRALRSSVQATHGAYGERITVCGDLVIDETERRVTIAGKPILLSKTEYRLLRVLARHTGKTVAHEILLEQVWGPAYRQEIEFVWVYIRRLRRKIEPDPSRPRYIHTAPGVGYQLTAPAPAHSSI